MKLSRKFLSDYVDIPSDVTIKDLAEEMTHVGNEYGRYAHHPMRLAVYRKIDSTCPKGGGSQKLVAYPYICP